MTRLEGGGDTYLVAGEGVGVAPVAVEKSAVAVLVGIFLCRRVVRDTGIHVSPMAPKTRTDRRAGGRAGRRTRATERAETYFSFALHYSVYVLFFFTSRSAVLFSSENIHEPFVVHVHQSLLIMLVIRACWL